MKDESHQTMQMQLIAALAALDAELELPDDGCNSTAQTLHAIRLLKLQRQSAVLNWAAASRRVAKLESELAEMRQRNAL